MPSVLTEEVNFNLTLVPIASGLRVVIALVAAFWGFVCLFVSVSSLDFSENVGYVLLFLLPCLAIVFPGSACWFWKLGKGEAGMVYGITKTMDGVGGGICSWCSIVDLAREETEDWVKGNRKYHAVFYFI